MTKPAIKVEGLWKEYVIGAQQKAHSTFYDMLSSSLSAPFRGLRKRTAEEQEAESFWALRDVNFEVQPGEVVGIIGRNGAGKSTLLKILSRITAPTRGHVEVRGRLASLLEVGTGFHPELSGRENVFLNGAILGMSRAEVARKFDEIVAFAEVEKFIDTPVKRYSSGMYVRLAFAVAAHLDADVLLVDEVLAVGDASFQEKCLTKVKDVAGVGRTVIVVSHTMSSIESLCSSVLWLAGGEVAQQSSNTRGAIRTYLASTSNVIGKSSFHWGNDGPAIANETAEPVKFAARTENDFIEKTVTNDTEIFVEFTFRVHKIDSGLMVGCVIFDDRGQPICESYATDESLEFWPRWAHGLNVARLALPKRFLNEGKYFVECHLSIRNAAWIVQPGVNSPRLSLSISGGMSDSPYWGGNRSGVLAPVWRWRAENENRIKFPSDC